MHKSNRLELMAVFST